MPSYSAPTFTAPFITLPYLPLSFLKPPAFFAPIISQSVIFGITIKFLVFSLFVQVISDGTPRVIRRTSAPPCPAQEVRSAAAADRAGFGRPVSAIQHRSATGIRAQQERRPGLSRQEV